MTNIDPILNMLTRGLTHSFQRQRLLASNIANAETPGYERKDVDAPNFAQIMSDANAQAEGAPHVVKGGPVVLEKEFAASSANSLYYASL